MGRQRHHLHLQTHTFHTPQGDQARISDAGLRKTEDQIRIGVDLYAQTQFAALYTDDPSTSKLEKSKIEGGAESVTDIEWKLDENILFTSKIEIFAAFKTFDRLDIRTDSKLTFTVNKYLSAMFNAQIVNFAPFPRTQIKQTIAVGLTYNVFLGQSLGISRENADLQSGTDSLTIE